MTNKTQNQLEEKLREQKKLQYKLEKKIINIKKQMKREKKKYLDRILPKVGKMIYVDEENFNRDDNNMYLIRGGLAEVISTTSNPEEYNLEVILMGDIHEYKRFTINYNWEKLYRKQKKLKGIYGNNLAKVDEKNYDNKIAFKKQEKEDILDLTEW